MRNNSLVGKIVLSALCCIMTAIITLSGIEMVCSSYIRVSDESKSVSGVMTYSENLNKKYEDSSLFYSIVEDAIGDITRLCVIRNQFETDGKYDANKIIDITQYANRSSLSAVASVNAEYTLDDLIKWGNNGFNFRVISGSKAQLDTCFFALQEGDMSFIKDYGEIVRLNDYDSNIPLDEQIEALRKNTHNGDNGYYTMYLLLDEYNSVDGRGLVSYAADRRSYDILVRNLCSSADSLAYNYSDYTRLYARYNENATNSKYCYKMIDSDGSVVKYTNVTGIGDAGTDIRDYFKKYKKYVCYNPDKNEIDTSIKNITSDYMKDAVNHYSYSFEDGSRIYFAVDDSYEADDIFSIGKSEYDNKKGSFLPALFVFIMSMLIFIILIIIATICAGRVIEIDSEGNKRTRSMAYKCDHLPIELFILISLAVDVLWLFVVINTINMFITRYDIVGADSGLVRVVMTFEMVLGCIVILPLYLMFVRKIKNRLIWNGSICRFVIKKTKEGALDVYDNGQIFIRTWLPYLLFLALNLVLVLIGNYRGILIAFIFDMIVGGLLYRETRIRNRIIEGIKNIADGDVGYKVDTANMHGDNLALANSVNSIGEGISNAVATSLKDEKLKADLITNVSHDIKTPLTSIINYVDLLKRENITDAKIRSYIAVLDQKSQRLKALTNDLVEASKISSGNISLNIEKINLVELVNQSVGEFSEKFEEKGLRIVISKPDIPVFIMADSRGVYRVVENLYNNIYKYSLENTRIYLDVELYEGIATLTLKNISAEPLNISTDELTERFIRGDISRKTEGSGLGLSIAKSLTEAMGGKFNISLDGDLFKVVVSFTSATR